MKTKKTIITAVLFLLVLLGAAGGFVAVRWYMDNRAPALRSGVTLRIYPQTTVQDVIDMLTLGDNAIHPASIRRVMEKENAAERLRCGLYKIDTLQPPVYIARAITRGWQNPVKVVVPDGLRFRDALCGAISADLMVDSTSLQQAFRDSLLMDKYSLRPSALFAYILPDTYEFYWDTTAENVLSRIRKEYDAFWNESRLKAAQAIGLTPYEVSVLASIVAQESNRADEFPKVASVYLNRLRKGIKLQACPTVCYIYGYSLRRVLYKHLRTDSPYNTYMYEGLPPTPICIPGKQHIEAVLHPDSTPYLYFCADSSFSGRNLFATSYSQHMRNARAYQAALATRMKNASSPQALDSLLITAPEKGTVQSE